MKKVFYIALVLIVSLFIFVLNIFFKINSDINHIISINIIFFINLIISLLCFLLIKRIFKKIDFNNLNDAKIYRQNLKTAVANSFFISSIVSIVSALIIYGFLEKFLILLNLKTGIINYTVFASKIWFISSPFIGLEITIFTYFYKLEYFKAPIKILIFKFITFILLSLVFYITHKTNCLIYSKPFTDLVFLFYYSKTCFDLTLK